MSQAQSTESITHDVNARNIHHLVTPDGVDMIARRSYRFLRRTVGHVVRYKERLVELLSEAAESEPWNLHI